MLDYFEESLEYLREHAESVHTFEKWEIFQIYLYDGTLLTIAEPEQEHFWTYDLTDHKERYEVKKIFTYLGFGELILKFCIIGHGKMNSQI